MNKFTICYNRNTWPALWQKRITSLSERMKSFTPPGKFILLALLCLLMTGNVAAQTRVQVNSNGKSSTSGSSLIVTLGYNTTIGNTLIAVVSTRGTSIDRVTGISGIGDWTRATQAANTGGNTIEIWYASNVQATSKIVTINLVSGLRAAAVVMEYSGILTTSPLDQTASATGNSKDAITGISPLTTQANELWIGGIGFSNSSYSLSNISNSFKLVTTTSVSSGSSTSSYNTELYALERIVNSAGPASTGGTLSTTNNVIWSGAIATFIKQPPPTPPYHYQL